MDDRGSPAAARRGGIGPPQHLGPARKAGAHALAQPARALAVHDLDRGPAATNGQLDERVDEGVELGGRHTVQIEFVADLDVVIGIRARRLVAFRRGGQAAAQQPAAEPGDGPEQGESEK